MNNNESMQKTIYYPEGWTVKTGDVVWNNEGVNVRKVISVVSEEEAKQVFVADGVTDGAGFFWSRYISESDLEVLDFESAESCEEEGVGKLSRPELLCVKFLFRLLGEQIGLNIWDNKDYLYYPVLWPEEKENGKYEWIWYLFFQPYLPPVTSFDEEQCFWFDEREWRFKKADRQKQDLVRGL